MRSWCGWLLCACVVKAVRFSDRLLEKKPMKTSGQVLDILNLSKRQNIPGMSRHIPMIRGANGPIATLLNIRESDADARAAIKGLSSYDGDLVVPNGPMTPVGYPVSLNIDKDPDDVERGDGPLFKLFPKDSAPIRKDIGGKTEEQKKQDEEKKKKEDDRKKEEEEKRKKEEEQKAEIKKKEIEDKKKDDEKKKIETEVRKKIVQEIQKLDDERRKEDKQDEERRKKETERKKQDEERKRKEEERKKQEAERKRQEAEKQKQEEEKKKTESNNKIDNTIKNIPPQQNNVNTIPRDKSFICYLPKIVVITRMIGTTVVNEVKVYGDSHNEKSVHKFISTHVVSANASELVNEFTLPPQFILGVSPDIEKDNDVSITKTAAYTNGGQLDIRPGGQPHRVVYQPQVVRPPVVKHPPNYNYGPHFTTKEPPQYTLVPTYNPFLPKKSSTTPATTTPITTPTTTPTPTVTSTKPSTTQTTTSKSWNIDIISDIITKKSKVKSKEDARGILEWLNYVARHRNAVADLPNGDSNAFTGYEMMPPNYSI